MATSTFSKHFVVQPKKAASFVNEMTGTVTPTLSKNFQSQSVHLVQNHDLRDKLKQALAKS